MPIAKITLPGLCAIAGSVGLLWALILGEGALMRRAYAERADVMRTMQVQQRRAVPHNVFEPRIPSRRSVRPSAG